MTGKWKAKPKKVVETSLGKAPKDAEKVPDLSHLKRPMITSVCGLKQVLDLFHKATPEVQEYICYECDILYECKLCRTIFRSLANFILHKRVYCREKYPLGDGDNEGGFVISEDLKTSDEESRSTTPTERIEDSSVKSEISDVKKHEKKTILPIIDKLLEKQKINILVQNTINEDLTAKNEDDDVIFVSEESNVVLEKIDGSSAAMFQTSVKKSEKDKCKEKLMKNEILEIHDILDNNQVVLDPSGKISPTQTSKLMRSNIPRPELTCTECNFTFSTEKTLTHHIKYKHNKTRVVFPCPDCKETFSNAWSVYRHLYKVHRRTTSQVKRMRHLVHCSGIRRDQEPEKKKMKLSVEENEENQWMNNLERDYYLQMCGGCGKRFERRAALHSHSLMCTKRIAVCNNIKNVKKNEKKAGDGNGLKLLKGAARRKPQFVSVTKRPGRMKFIGVCEPLPSRLSTLGHRPGMNHEEANVKASAERDEQEVVSVGRHTEVDPLSETSDVTITKHTDDREQGEQIKIVPEIEIFTISDDSAECETQKIKDFPKFHLSDEYKEYVNDDADHCFLANASHYLDSNELKCVPCEMNFLDLYRLLRHMSLHYSWFRFQCSKCAFMSFHKDDCTSHAYTDHSTPNNLMDSTVLPIPKWKVLCMSHDFKQLNDDIPMKMPQLKPIKETCVESSETIVLDDDDMPDIIENNENDSFADPLIVSDDEIRENGTSERKKDIKSSQSQVSNSRPVRNRMKSVKTAQNDFIYEYDLGKVFKYNDGSMKKKK